MQKIRKILGAVSEKTTLPTNYYQQHRSYKKVAHCKQSQECESQISSYLITKNTCAYFASHFMD